jgi:hypothetical protein
LERAKKNFTGRRGYEESMQLTPKVRENKFKLKDSGFSQEPQQSSKIYFSQLVMFFEKISTDLYLGAMY